MNVCIFWGSNSAIYVIVSLLSRGQILEERILFQLEQILWTLFLEGLVCPVEANRNSQKLFPFVIWQKNMAINLYTFMEEKKKNDVDKDETVLEAVYMIVLIHFTMAA